MELDEDFGNVRWAIFCGVVITVPALALALCGAPNGDTNHYHSTEMETTQLQLQLQPSNAAWRWSPASTSCSGSLVEPADQGSQGSLVEPNGQYVCSCLHLVLCIAVPIQLQPPGEQDVCMCAPTSSSLMYCSANPTAAPSGAGLPYACLCLHLVLYIVVSIQLQPPGEQDVRMCAPVFI